ncbi:ComEC/Rec2 family competence protein, partial [Candidatus Uhrbacteria bacterium]|nr:ComEC/Rec2 family competence protein [Candidatus Uhrbacteria bacterium]
TIAAFVVAFERRGRQRVLVLAVVGGCGLGALRLLSVMPVASPAIPSKPAMATVEGSVARVDGRAVLLRQAAMVPERGMWLALERPVRITMPSTGTASYGDTVRVRCWFIPSDRPGDRITRAGRCIARSVGDLRVLATGGGSMTMRAILRFRDRLTAVVDATLPEPAASIVAGVLFGVDGRLPEDTIAAFRNTGTIHVLVVSGWQMTLIGSRFRRTLTTIGMPRQTAILLAGFLLFGFTAMVGFSPPAVRGALTVAAFLAVDALGRVSNPLRVLLLVGTGMVAVSPHVLLFDLGFQLSFAAMAGLLLVSPMIERVIADRFDRMAMLHRIAMSHIGAMLAPWGRELRSLLAASVAAAIATAPFLLHIFGTVALLAPLVNIPVLLILPILMGIGAIAAGIGVLSTMLALPFAWAATTLANAMVRTVEWASALSWAPTIAYRFDAWFLVGMATIIVAVVAVWYRRRGGSILSPFAAMRDA